jgi:hypothetical protein
MYLAAGWRAAAPYMLKIYHGILTMEHCATTDMVADFFTKLTQGT